tara:strand:- start:11698 stop:12000 length:303 start_codon:yes stop_codon:yes gene_type:complete
MDTKPPKNNNLKIFFIKLVSISIAIIIVLNALFNLLLADKIEKIDKFLLLTEVQERKELGDRIRNDLKDLLKKDKLINEDDKVLLFKLYKKLKLEFKNIE